MSRWISQEAERLAPYTPGEQPQDQQYVKLNTNESPFPPSPKVLKAINRAEILKLNLYSDPTCAALTEAIARRYELKAKNVLAGNGSDEVLAFAFRAFCGAGQPVAFADVTYGFYKSQAALFDLDVKIIPLREDFTLHVDDYMDFPGTIVIANPNAPTGIAVPRNDIQRLLEANPDRVVIVDEAYVDFGAESCVPMIYRYDNLLVTQTMSKSRSLAGGRVGYALGSPELIADLNRVYDGDLGTALADTYTSESFLTNLSRKQAKLFDGVRCDSGDEFAFVDELVSRYRDFGIDSTTKTIIFSNALDFEKALRIQQYCKGKIRCAFGIGTNLTNDAGYKPSNVVMKLARCKMNVNQPWRECVKLSDDMGKHMGSDREVEACLYELGLK